MAATIKDVAKLAGVSITTVSFVINNNPAVKLITRKKVLDVIKQCNYKPNQNARSLVTKSKKIIEVIRMMDENTPSPNSFNSTVDTFLSEMLWYIEAGIKVHDYSLLLNWYNMRESPEQIPVLVDPNKADGIICVGGMISDNFMDALCESGLPAVLVGARSPRVDHVDVDGEKAIYLTTDYLIKNGNKRIAFINNTDLTKSSCRKLTGFQNAVKGGAVKTWVSTCPFGGQAAYDAFAQIWENAGEKPTAVVCAHDSMAIGVMRYMNDHGLRCPEDLSVIGYEDGLLAEYCVPAMSTVRIHKSRLGTEACEILFNRFRNSRAHRVSRIIEPELVIRNSTKERK
jgi:DNA-binding LacI/PurR family transcriptional regulator